MKKIALAGLVAAFGASAALASTIPAVANAASSCCNAVCCALGLPCC